ncbi:MAG: SMC-Scp complex subunit ScpB [Oscillospiraceae bacterium]
MEIHDIEAAIEAILFASGEPVSAERIAAILAVEKETIFDTAVHLADKYSFERRGIRLVRLDNALQLCTSPEYSDYIRLALETRKPPQLSQPAMEVLAVIAYYQPVTRAYIEQVRGVDSSYTVGLLCERGLIEPCGKLAVPGRPVLFRTTKNFLRVFSISSLEELPELPDEEADADGQMRIQSAIDALRSEALPAGGADDDGSGAVAG